MSTQAAEHHEKAAEQYGATQMIRHFLQAVTFASAVMFLVPTFAVAAEMTCTATDANGCIMAKGGDGKETKVTAPGAKVGDKMNCDDKGTCTKKLMQ